MPSEHELLALIAARDARMRDHYPHVLLGPGDDCALVAPAGPALLTVDQVIEGRHVLASLGPSLIARKALARSLSDIAAMAGSPSWALATGAIPDDLTRRTGFGAAELCDALHHWAAHFGLPIVGGDLSGTSGPLILTVTVGGAPHPARGPVLRAGSRPGDGLYVTGALGGSLASGRHATFTPRIAEAAALADALGPRLTAMIDLSDGLGQDAAHIARASGVRIEIDARLLPVHDDVRRADEHAADARAANARGEFAPAADAPGEKAPANDLRTPDARDALSRASNLPSARAPATRPPAVRTPWRCALEDGEDYELCFTASGEVPASICGTRITRIGEVAQGSGCTIRTPTGERLDAANLGWNHPLGR